MKNIKITLPSKIESLKKIFSILEELDIDSKKLFNLQLIIEEIVVNICSYAYGEDKKGTFQFEINIPDNSEDIYLKFVDNGIPFDPTKKELKLNTNLKEANIGGLGIHLVKQLSKSFKYSRVDNMNILEIVI